VCLFNLFIGILNDYLGTNYPEIYLADLMPFELVVLMKTILGESLNNSKTIISVFTPTLHLIKYKIWHNIEFSESNGDDIHCILCPNHRYMQKERLVPKLQWQSVQLIQGSLVISLMFDPRNLILGQIHLHRYYLLGIYPVLTLYHGLRVVHNGAIFEGKSQRLFAVNKVGAVQ